ncbi:MAG: S41 family peptidase [Bacteroidales bacterium]|jgi:carboxyl-terminal processing protease|nr:S41 family peptidase [Bacteroidales bacterium]
MKKRTGLAVTVAVILLAALTTGFLTSQESKDFRLAKNLDIFFSLIREVNTFYVDEINPEKIIKTGIDNMLKTLDPYTVYYPESNVDELSFMTSGKYGGIGSLVRNNGNYAVVGEVYKGFPADKAGIKAGDILKAVDGESLKGYSTEKVSEKLKGNPGSEITITVERNSNEIDFKLKRERIAINPVPYYGMLDAKTGYIRFSNFTQNCIDEVKTAMAALKGKNAQQIILDLRGNPGGLLTEAVNIVNLFVGPGNEVVSTKGKVSRFDESFKTEKPAVDETIPLAVLINSSSASASEIVAGALQDLDRGIIIGQRSFGKGLVQVTRPLSYNTQLKVTAAKYYIPSGRCIQARDFSHPNADGSTGIIPDSLMKEFKTRNGRTVKDGGGIAPDIEIKPETLSQIATELYLGSYIFDFATQYYWANPGITTPEMFSFSDNDYNDFRSFLEKRNFSYTTLTEDSFNEMINVAKKEKYYDRHKATFEALEKELSHSLDKDLELYRIEISELIEDEIVRRYFYDAGAIAHSIHDDIQIKKAVETLNSRETYEAILKNGSMSSVTVYETAEAPAKVKKTVNRRKQAGS